MVCIKELPLYSKTNIMEKSFEFSYCLGEVEYIQSNENIGIEESTELVKKLIETGEIEIGERVEGSVTFDDEETTYSVYYRYCNEVGEDWDEDDWSDDIEVDIEL